MTVLPRIAVTTGDPAGIGPEIVAAACRDPLVTSVCTPIVYGPIAEAALAGFAPGRIDAGAGRCAYDEVTRAVDDALARRVDALTTGPINKAAWAAAGLPWRGHTDLLAHLCGVPDVGMMFWSERLCVVLATVHVPLAEVAAALTPDRLRAIIHMTAAAMPRFGVPTPRIAVAGLNPHAGEGGLLGREEMTVFGPVLASARSAGLDVSGPWPADTVFVRAARGEFDVVIAAYHDQGLIPVKLLAFGQAVNVTIGLPIIRTSVDHGTAFDIARRGTADASSMVAAIRLAARLAAARSAEGGA